MPSVVTRGYIKNMVASVRVAKAKLSELLERAATGEDVVITSAGRPKARIVALDGGALPFRVNRRLLAARSRRKGPPAEAIVRADRDARD